MKVTPVPSGTLTFDPARSALLDGCGQALLLCPTPPASDYELGPGAARWLQAMVLRGLDRSASAWAYRLAACSQGVWSHLPELLRSPAMVAPRASGQPLSHQALASGWEQMQRQGGTALYASALLAAALWIDILVPAHPLVAALDLLPPEHTAAARRAIEAQAAQVILRADFVRYLRRQEQKGPQSWVLELRCADNSHYLRLTSAASSAAFPLLFDGELAELLQRLRIEPQEFLHLAQKSWGECEVAEGWPDSGPTVVGPPALAMEGMLAAIKAWPRPSSVAHYGAALALSSAPLGPLFSNGAQSALHGGGLLLFCRKNDRVLSQLALGPSGPGVFCRAAESWEPNTLPLAAMDLARYAGEVAPCPLSPWEALDTQKEAPLTELGLSFVRPDGPLAYQELCVSVVRQLEDSGRPRLAQALRAELDEGPLDRPDYSLLQRYVRLELCPAPLPVAMAC